MNIRRSILFASLAGIFILSGPFLWAEEAAKNPEPAASQKQKKQTKALPASNQTKSLTTSAEAAKPTMSKTLEAWLKKMQKRVNSSRAKQNKLVSVAAVRGAEREDTPPLYWKGNKSQGQVSMNELEGFDSIIATAMNGNSAEATAKLEKFMADNPNSALTADAQETLKMLKNESNP